jgi:hypothetical protein
MGQSINGISFCIVLFIYVAKLHKYFEQTKEKAVFSNKNTLFLKNRQTLIGVCFFTLSKKG